MMRAHHHRQRGFTLLELTAVFSLLLMAGGALTWWLTSYYDTQAYRAAAQQLDLVAEAAERYVGANFAAVEAAAQAAGGATRISLTDLKSAGYLDPAFQDRNPNDQQHAVVARRVGAGRLAVLAFTYGGRPFGDSALSRVGPLLTGRGGYVLSRNDPAQAPSGQPLEIVGAYGGWRAVAADYAAGGVQPQVGYPVVRVFFSDGAVVGQYLHRFQVSGAPEANRMETNLDMGGHDIVNVGTIWADEVKIRSLGDQDLSEGVYIAGVYEAGETIPRPSCPPGKTAQVFTAVQAWADNGAGEPPSAVQTGTNASGTQAVHRIRTSAGWIGDANPKRKLLAFVKCSS